MCTVKYIIRPISLLLLLLTFNACTQTSPSLITISGQVLDEKSNMPVPAINVRLEAVLSPRRDSPITTALTDASGKYTIRVEPAIIKKYGDTAGGKKTFLRLHAEPVQASRTSDYKNPYRTDRKGAPDLFFGRVDLPWQILQEHNIKQDIKMNAGAAIVCYSPPGYAPSGPDAIQWMDTILSLDVTGMEKPRDHFRVVVNSRRFLVIRPGHPYVVKILYQYTGADTSLVEHVIKRDTVRLKPMDTLGIHVSADMIKMVTGRMN